MLEKSERETVAGLIRRDLADFGLEPAADEDMVEAHALAERLIGGNIVSAENLARVHRRSGAGLFLAREERTITGVLAFVLLNAAGLRAVLADTFDAVAPPSRHIARPQDEVRALYGWGVAATTKPSAGRLLDGAQAMGERAVAHLAHYARPATAAGERLMRERLGFVDVSGSRTGLVWAPPFDQKAEAA